MLSLFQGQKTWNVNQNQNKEYNNAVQQITDGIAGGMFGIT